MTRGKKRSLTWKVIWETGRFGRGGRRGLPFEETLKLFQGGQRTWGRGKEAPNREKRVYCKRHGTPRAGSKQEVRKGKTLLSWKRKRLLGRYVGPILTEKKKNIILVVGEKGGITPGRAL